MWRSAAVLAVCFGQALQASPAPQIETDQREEAAKVAALQTAFEAVDAYFKDRHDLQLSEAFVLVGTDAPETMGRLLGQGLRALDRRPQRRPIDTQNLCANKRVGAAANRNYILMCWQRPQAYNVDWSTQVAPRITTILAHEFTHQVQYELARDRPAKRSKPIDDWLLGPNWMVEGLAELVETDFVTPLSGFTGRDIFNLQTRARRSRVTLSELTKSRSVKGPAAYGVARFACLMLARKHGIEALFAYFEALGRLRDRDRAFEAVFGQSFGEFEAEFEILRRDFGAARDYQGNGT